MDRTRMAPGTRAGGTKHPRKVVLAVAVCLLAGAATAQICDSRWPQLQFARDDLQRAASEGDLASAQDYADRTRREFDQLAALAVRCGCPSAAAKFEEGAVHIRRAQDAESRRELREIVGGAKAIFEAAQTQLQDCRKH